ncbi:histidine phosphatase family protein [Paenibacillus sp. SAF-068]|uniref:histidine phosphatase family protein n=1 Tax=Paenibacillus sp. SAF-068 TaxID=3436864 RepID=UPI003F7E27FB
MLSVKSLIESIGIGGVSSNLTRARQTAEIIQQCLGVPVFTDERIREINCC